MSHPTLLWVVNSTLTLLNDLNEFGGGFFFVVVVGLFYLVSVSDQKRPIIT